MFDVMITNDSEWHIFPNRHVSNTDPLRNIHYVVIASWFFYHVTVTFLFYSPGLPKLITNYLLDVSAPPGFKNMKYAMEYLVGICILFIVAFLREYTDYQPHQSAIESIRPSLDDFLNGIFNGATERNSIPTKNKPPSSAKCYVFSHNQISS
jgi:hypothetical protein